MPSKSAPVKGRLLGPSWLAPAAAGRAAVWAGATVELPDTVGVVTQLGWVIDPVEVQVAAPAAPDAMASEATANPEPTISRLAHMMFAPSFRRDCASTSIQTVAGPCD
jgi:hypothetical protein